MYYFAINPNSLKSNNAEIRCLFRRNELQSLHLVPDNLTSPLRQRQQSQPIPSLVLHHHQQQPQPQSAQLNYKPAQYHYQINSNHLKNASQIGENEFRMSTKIIDRQHPITYLRHSHFYVGLVRELILSRTLYLHIDRSCVSGTENSTTFIALPSNTSDSGGGFNTNRTSYLSTHNNVDDGGKSAIPVLLTLEHESWDMLLPDNTMGMSEQTYIELNVKLENETVSRTIELYAENELGERLACQPSRHCVRWCLLTCDGETINSTKPVMVHCMFIVETGVLKVRVSDGRLNDRLFKLWFELITDYYRQQLRSRTPLTTILERASRLNQWVNVRHNSNINIKMMPWRDPYTKENLRDTLRRLSAHNTLTYPHHQFYQFCRLLLQEHVAQTHPSYSRNLIFIPVNVEVLHVPLIKAGRLNGTTGVTKTFTTAVDDDDAKMT